MDAWSEEDLLTGWLHFSLRLTARHPERGGTYETLAVMRSNLFGLQIVANDVIWTRFPWS